MTRPARVPGAGCAICSILLLVLFAGTGLWTWLTLQWAYSDGTRSGVLQKFSRSGWLCKTQEGELALYFGGALAADLAVSACVTRAWRAQIEKAVGARVQLHYTEHPGVPSTCFADTRYFVDGVTVTDPLAGRSRPRFRPAPRPPHRPPQLRRRRPTPDAARPREQPAATVSSAVRRDRFTCSVMVNATFSALSPSSPLTAGARRSPAASRNASISALSASPCS